jgi:hypothetical protein
MGEALQLLAFLGQLEHPEGALDVYADRIFKPSVEIDTCSAVDDDIAVLAQFLEIFGAESQSILQQVSFSE